jgi:hypothetical protein
VHEYGIEIRGVLQSDEKLCIREERVPIANLISSIIRNQDQIATVMRKYTQRIRGYNSRKENTTLKTVKLV